MSEQTAAERYASAALDYPWPAGKLPSAVGRGLILALNAKRGWYEAPPILWEQDIPEAPEVVRANTVREWRRLPTPDEINRFPYVHVYDRAGDYLSIAEGAMLPIGRPEWNPEASYRKEPGKSAPAGLWHVCIDYDGSPWNGRDLPAVCKEGWQWLWTPALRAALDCGYWHSHGSGAILWSEQHHILGTWAKRVWQARRALEEQLAEEAHRNDFSGDRIQALNESIRLIKLLYTSTIGMFAYRQYERRERSEEEAAAGVAEYDVARWYRPEWHRTILAEALARTFYTMRKAVMLGMPPLFSRVDTLAFCSDDGPEVTAAAAGLFTTAGKCGAWRHEYELFLVGRDAPLLRTAAADIVIGGETHKLPRVRQ